MSDVLSETELRMAQRMLAELTGVLNGVLFGQEDLIESVVIGLLSSGHILLEGLPGLGKTQLVKGLAKAIALEEKRIQFTPDLLPGDITGNPILQESGGSRRFVFQRGPLFANLVLADEINRASPKTQSALLEAMQERTVTVMGETHLLPDPFFVLATQNPIELEGTYPLPEAQLDRFLFKLEVLKSDVATLERIIVHREIGKDVQVERVLDRSQLVELSQLSRRVHLPNVVVRYIARLVDATHPGQSRTAEQLTYGASPRAALAMAAASKARALIQGRPNASYEDVRVLAKPVLRHRIVLNYNAKLDGATSSSIVDALLAEIPAHDRELPPSLESASS